MKDTTAYIWLEKIFNNKYKCKCGYKLCVLSVIKEAGGLRLEPVRDVMIDQYDNSMYCPKCGEYVGYVEKLGLTNMESGTYGHWPHLKRRLIAYASQERADEDTDTSFGVKDSDS